MAAQISVEDAFPTFQKKCTELFEENMLLRAQADVHERQMAALGQEKTGLEEQVRGLELQLSDARAENEQLRAVAPQLGAPPAEQASHGNHADLDQQDDLERAHG